MTQTQKKLRAQKHNFSATPRVKIYIGCPSRIYQYDTRAKRLRLRKVSVFKIAVANANFISIHWSFSLFALTELSDMMTKTATMATGEVLPERAWTFKHDFRLWCKEESMWCKREELKQLINFVFVKF